MKTKVLICTFTFLLVCVLQVAYAGPGAIFSGDSIKLLKEQLKFKNTDGLIRYNTTDSVLELSNDNGATWNQIGVPHLSSDKDGDTLIQLEETTDEDTVRVDIQGNENIVVIDPTDITLNDRTTVSLEDNSTDTALSLETNETFATSSNQVLLQLQRNATTPPQDGTGIIQRFLMDNDIGSPQEAAEFRIEWDDVTNGSEDSDILFALQSNGSQFFPLKIGGEEGVSIQGYFDFDTPGALNLTESLNGGANYVTLKAPAVLGANYSLEFPADDGEEDQILTTDGSGVLSWSDQEGGEHTYQEVFPYDNGFADNHPAFTAIVNSGNSATFTNSGTLDGTFELSTTSTELYDSNESTKVFKYTSGTGTTLNNWVTPNSMVIPQGARNNGSGFQDILVRAWYWNGFADGNISPKLYCVIGGDAGEVDHLANVALDNNDLDEDGIKDAAEGSFLELAYSVPSTCEFIYFGFHQLVEEDSKVLIFDRVEMGILPRNMVDVVGESSYYKMREAGSTMTNVVGEWQFSGAVTTTEIGDSSQCFTMDHGSDPSTLTMVNDCVLHMDAYALNAGTNDEVTAIVKNSTLPPVSMGSVGDAITANIAGAVATTIIAKKGETYTVAIVGKDEASYGTMFSGSSTRYAHWSITATPLSNKMLIVPSADTNQAGFFGSVKWDTTTGCQWISTSGTMANFPADAQCDDNLRTIRGSNNVTSGAVGNADGQLPQIKFSAMPAGTYEFSVIGHLYNNASTCAFSFSDGTNNSTRGNEYHGVSDHSTRNFIGRLHYDTKQGATTIQLQNDRTFGSGNCVVNSESHEAELEIAVYYYPPHDRQPKINYLFPTVEYQQEPEEYIASDWIGYPSANTALAYFGTVTKNTISGLGTVVNDSTDGFIFTASKKVQVTMTHRNSATTSLYTGISKNPTDTEMDTALGNIAENKIVAMTYVDGTEVGEATFTGILEAGDFLAAHIIAGKTPYGTAGWQGINLKVTPIPLTGNVAAILAPEDGMYGVLMTDGAADSDADLDIAATMTDLGGSGTEWQSVVTDGISVGAGGVITLPATKATYSVIMKAGVAVTTGSSKTVSMQMLQGDGAYSIVPFSRSEVVGNSGDSLLLSINTRIRVTGSTDNMLKIQMSNSGVAGDAVLRSNRTTGVADAPGFVIYITQQR